MTTANARMVSGWKLAVGFRSPPHLTAQPPPRGAAGETMKRLSMAKRYALRLERVMTLYRAGRIADDDLPAVVRNYVHHDWYWGHLDKDLWFSWQHPMKHV